MLSEIQEIIKKNLPQEVSENLRKVLEQGEIDAENLVSTRREIQTLNMELGVLKKQKQTQDNLSSREANVKNRENVVKEKELRHELEAFKVTAAEARTKDLKEIVSLVFQNNQYKHTRNLSKSIPATGNNGYQYTQDTNEHESTDSEG